MGKKRKLITHLVDIKNNYENIPLNDTLNAKPRSCGIEEKIVLKIKQNLSQQLKINRVAEALDFTRIISVRVIQCIHSYGCIIESKKGWKFVYSGNSKPCPQLVKVAKDATLLIHNATPG